MSNIVLLMRRAGAAQANGWFALYHRAIYRATWAEAQNLGDDTLLRELLENVGVPATTLMAYIERQEVKGPIASEHRPGRRKRRVRSANVLQSVAEMFWGNDRFDFVEQALRKLV